MLGRGPEGMPISIGVELKALGDLCTCFIDGRLTGHQLPGLLDRYQIVYLLVEGPLIREHGGGLKGQSVGYDEIQAFLTTLEQKAGLVLGFSRDREQSAAWIAAKYRWWNGKEYEQHRSHLKPHREGGFESFDTTRRMKVAMALAEGVGPVKARAADEHFHNLTPAQMVNAGEDEWMQVKGIGTKLAKFIVREANTV